jgi:curved DNA-binding protein CbpA
MSLYPPDPWRALQLPRDASLEEVKAAYRRLAKRYHPDSAGESALPRFLAIQAAYESLTEGPYRLRLGTGRGPTTTGPRPTSTGPRPTTNGSRARRPPPAGGATTDGRPIGTSRQRPDPRPEGGRPDASAHSKRGARGRPSGTSGTSSTPRSRRRAKAGSTSYDEAISEPFEPDWQGGSWYGESSGTYWTINPREYADPRKHGPEYQARARQAAARGYSMPGDRPDPQPDRRDSTKPDGASETSARADSTDRQGAAGDSTHAWSSVDWSAAYEDADAVGADDFSPGASTRRADDDGAWSSPGGLVGLALVSLIAVTVAMLTFDGAVGSARPALVWVGAAALLVVALARLIVTTRRGTR